MRHVSDYAPAPLDVLDLTEWTEIARLNTSGMGQRWIPVEGAPFSVRDATRYYEQGRLLKARRITDAGEFVVVKRRLEA